MNEKNNDSEGSGGYLHVKSKNVGVNMGKGHWKSWPASGNWRWAVLSSWENQNVLKRDSSVKWKYLLPYQ